jgi:hypothetical protein
VLVENATRRRIALDRAPPGAAGHHLAGSAGAAVSAERAGARTSSATSARQRDGPRAAEYAGAEVRLDGGEGRRRTLATTSS